MSSGEYLIPELQDSDWELVCVEVSSDEQPQEMEYGWLVESYWFEHGEQDLELTCNLESYEDGSRDYEVYVYARSEEPFILNFRSRLDWWTGIRNILADRHSEVSIYE
jgi:hypothetical protein